MRERWALAVAAAGLLLLATPARPLSLLLAVWLLAALAPGRTWATRVLAGTVLGAAGLATSLSLLAVAGLQTAPELLVAIGLAVAAGGVAFRPPRPVALLDAQDAISLGLGLLVAAVLGAPLVGASVGQVVAQLAHTTDSGTHAQLVAAVARHDGFVHLLPAQGMTAGAENYPTGWHGAVWVVADLLGSSLATVHSLAVAVALGAVVTYGLLVAVCCRTALGSGGRTALGATLVALGTAVGPAVLLVQLASYTQVLALAAVLVATWWDRRAPVRSSLLLMASLVVVSQAWYLLLPVAGCVALCRLPRLVATVRAHPAWAAPVALLAGAATCYPVLVGPGRAQLELPGPVLLPTLPGVLGILVAAAVGVAFARRRAQPLAVAVVGLLLLLAALVVVQGFISGSGVSYYGAKLLLSLGVLGTVAAARAAASSRSRWWGVSLVALLVTVATVRSLTVPPGLAAYDTERSARLVDSATREHAAGARPGERLYVLTGCNRVNDLILTKWLYDTGLSWSPELLPALNDWALGDPRALSALVDGAQVYSDHDSCPALDQLLVGSSAEVTRAR